MCVTTANGATAPSGPAPGDCGVREYRETDRIDDIRAADGAIEKATECLYQSVDLVSAILTVVIAGAAAYAGINVMSNVASTMSLSQGDMFYNASQNLEDGIGSFFSQMPTVFVVIALVLIIGYLTILRR
jgi:hypothetical protein